MIKSIFTITLAVFASTLGAQNLNLDLQQANRLASLPAKCLQNEYPNKTGQVLENALQLGTPKELHPAFYGCFDWHSSVHGHWSLVKLLKDFPQLANREAIILQLQQNLSKENIQKEILYFNRKQEYSYERMYGWTWLMKLQQELDTWDTLQAKQLAQNLQPLTDILVKRTLEFLPKLNYPLRVGMHSNTAFGLSFIYDYGKHSQNKALVSEIENIARRLYYHDQKCPIQWEPGGFDFLSPCLEELTLMQRILPEKEFLSWADDFLPQLKNKKFQLEVAKVSDREDGHLVHLDGFNFSRAWVFYRLAKAFPKKYGHLSKEADKYLAYSLPSITDGSYEGEHWLASFALYALSQRETVK
ncbi:DUF2891 domain-containing protein [Elizabethkingia sp. JS20170427COW]|uniref:DUF2891 domain-containing protein n=1 Tax=Elizabethkingia sp. JS20170427COW TaxID=2583851 RepID=UPI001110454C|nr:DUF2891 domain-containing protein [Elizabethkingia sp. JS20170427COW]QCX53965.1 DUF2891 domain-containing protein [Elizabethkingia sp. JS20170427COW]